MELRNEIGRSFGLQLPGTLVFDYPTAAAIGAFVHSKLAGSQGNASSAAMAPAPALR